MHSTFAHADALQIVDSRAAFLFQGFLIVMNDGQIFYQVGVAVFGAVKGLVQLNLGSVTDFQEVVLAFHKAPGRWWKAGTSAEGKANIMRCV